MDRDRKVLIVEMQEAARDAARAAIRPSQLTDKFQVALAEKVQAAREELINLLSKYTEIHPLVKEQHAKIDALKKEMDAMESSGATNRVEQSFRPWSPELARRGGTNSVVGMTEAESDFEILRTQLQALEASRAQLITRQREAQLF